MCKETNIYEWKVETLIFVPQMGIRKEILYVIWIKTMEEVYHRSEMELV